MKLLKKLFIMLFLSMITILSCIFYAFQIEPYRLTVNEYYLNDKQPEKIPVKIVQISDLHIKEDFTYKHLDKVVKRVNSLHPDIVIFTGDLYDNYAKYHDDKNIIANLQKIKANYDKIAIWGNRDYGGGAVRQYESIMEQSDFILLKNENLCITLDNHKKVLFTGLDDSLLGSPYMPDSIKNHDADYTFLLTHEPDTIEDYYYHDYDMILSGHSHGGQVNIPFLPGINQRAVSSTSLSTKYSGGMYVLDSAKNKKLYVNTGIGTTHISARFGVIPEVAVFYAYL